MAWNAVPRCRARAADKFGPASGIDVVWHRSGHRQPRASGMELQSIRCARLCRGVCRRVRGDGPEAGDSSEGEQRRKPKVTGSNPVRPSLDSSEGEHRSSKPSVAGSTPAPSTMTCHVMTSEREFHTRTRSARRAVLDTLRHVAMPGPPQQTRRRARVLEARGPVRNARNRTPSRRGRPDRVSAPGARPLRDGAARAVSTFFAEFTPLHRAHSCAMCTHGRRGIRSTAAAPLDGSDHQRQENKERVP